MGDEVVDATDEQWVVLAIILIKKLIFNFLISLLPFDCKTVSAFECNSIKQLIIDLFITDR